MKRSRLLPGQLIPINRDATAPPLSLHARGHGFFILLQTTTRITMFKNIPSFVAAAFLLALGANAAWADIYQWEYINPANPSQGKQESTTLAPGGAGVNAVPGAGLGNLNLTQAFLIGKDLHGAYAWGANLTRADLSHANLMNAVFRFAYLTDANLTGAEVRGADFSDNDIGLAQLYSTASYQAHDLTGINLTGMYLAGANFAGQNLTNSFFSNESSIAVANVFGADFTGAEIRDASLGYLTLAQLYSTASYQAHDLRGVTLPGFYQTNYADANYTGIDIRGASLSLTLAQLYSTASYQAHDLTGVRSVRSNFSGADFTGQNLTNANLDSVALDGANFTNATVRGARFSNGAPDYPDSGITLLQVYSTASYQIHDLRGITLFGNDLSAGNFAGQDFSGANLNAKLTGANFMEANLSNVNFAFDPYGNSGGLDLTGANFTRANLTDAYFYYNDDVTAADLTAANLTAADARGARFPDVPQSALTANLIRPNGHIAGLDLTAGASLIVRDYDGNPSTGLLPIVVDQHLASDATGTLRLEFEADPWDSTISFAPAIPVALGGTLELNFASGMSLAGQVGRTFDLFDWAGVTPTGAFTVSSPYIWNLTNLYTTGQVTLLAIPGLPGDFNHDGTVDAADYVVWRKTGLSPTDYNDWRTHFGQTAFSGSSGYPLGASGGPLSAAVPEPTSLVLVMCGLLVVIVSYRRAPTSSKLLPAKSAVAVLSLVVASTSHLAPARAASITSLGFDGVPHGVTNDGSLVVGEYSIPGIANYAVAWRAVGGVKTLGSGTATAVTADGSFAVGQLNNGTSFSGGPLPFSPIRWTNTTTVSLGRPPGVSSAGAFGMSADGSVVMIESGSCGSGGCRNGGSGAQFFRWTQATGIVPLGFGGGWGTGVSADGSVIVGYIPGPHAFRWTAATGAADLGTLNGAFSSEARAVSADGSVVVGESGGHAFRWTEATGMVDLGVDGAAFAESADGSIVIGGYDNSGSGTYAFYWSPSAGARLLSDVLHDNYGLDMSGWYLNQALAISPNGRFIVGRGFTPSGNGVWMADLQVPEPPNFTIAVCAIAAASIVRSPRGSHLRCCF
jgi:probable HAF family extracellular repeat protein